MRRLQSIHDIQAYRQTLSGLTIGFVPTMGALHEGHASLIRHAQSTCDITIVSVFVNPTQFGPSEDFDRYPRPIEEDMEFLTSLGVDVVFTPSESDIYPDGKTHTTVVYVPEIGNRYCGASRPSFFQGVCMVVLRLFNLIRPTHAFFGEKDFQQLMIIRRMAQDLFVPVTVIGCPIVRDKTGLAMSSRNRYLSFSDQKKAAWIHKSLQKGVSLFQNGTQSASVITEAVRHSLASHHIEIDYCVIVDSDTFSEVSTVTSSSRILFGGWVASVRLIDSLSFLSF